MSVQMFLLSGLLGIAIGATPMIVIYVIIDQIDRRRHRERHRRQMASFDDQMYAIIVSLNRQDAEMRQMHEEGKL